MSNNSRIVDNRAADRRLAEGRRASGVSVSEERRQTESGDRRASTDRRGWPFGIILRTTESYSILEDWLEDNCSGKWGLGLEDMDEALTYKSFKVMFELESDKLRFTEYFSKR